MKIQIVIKNRLGEFKSNRLEIDEESYGEIKNLSENFYNGGYEMETENGFVVIPPDLIKESILLIEIL